METVSATAWHAVWLVLHSVIYLHVCFVKKNGRYPNAALAANFQYMFHKTLGINKITEHRRWQFIVRFRRFRGPYECGGTL